MADDDPRAVVAEHLGIAPPEEWEQDWVWCVNDPDRSDEYLRLYESSEVSDDEREVLIEMLIQNVADLAEGTGKLPSLWAPVSRLLKARPQLHADTVAYCSGFEPPHEWASVGAAMRDLVAPAS